MPESPPPGRPAKHDDGTTLVMYFTLLALICLIPGLILVMTGVTPGRTFGAILFLLGMLVFVAMFVPSTLADQRLKRRKRLNHCIECDYPFDNEHVTTPCPECGAAPWFIDPEPSGTHHIHQHMKRRNSARDDKQISPRA